MAGILPISFFAVSACSILMGIGFKPVADNSQKFEMSVALYGELKFCGVNLNLTSFHFG